MDDYRDRLEGGYRLHRIRRIRRVAYTVLVALALVLLILGFVARGASFKPIFIPLDTVVVTLLVFLLIASLVAVYFRRLEILYARKDSQKHLMARNSTNQAIVVIALAVVLLVVFAPPITRQAVGASLSDPGSDTLNPSEVRTYTLANQDSVGLVHVEAFRVTATTGRIRVTASSSAGRTDAADLTAPADGSFGLQSSRYAVYTITIVNRGVLPASYAYSVDKNLFPDVYTTLPLLALAFVVSQVVWAGHLRPLRLRTATASIYSVGYDQELTRGESVFADYARRKVRTVLPKRGRGRAVEAVPTTAEPGPETAEPPPPPPSTLPPPPDPATLLLEARLFLETDQTWDALAKVEEALTLDAASVPALETKAEILARMGRRPEALAVYERVWAIDPRREPALRGIASIHVAERRWDAALSAANAVLKAHPGDPAATEWRADALAGLGRRQEAAAAYETVLRMHPGDEALRQKLEAASIDVPALLSRALIASASGDYSGALERFDTVLRVEPENVNALIGKAVAHRRAGRADEALACLDTVLKHEEGNPSALLNVGRIRMDRGEIQAALDTFERLISATPRDDAAWTAKGAALSGLGREDEAIDAYRRALELNAGNKTARDGLKELEDARGAPGGLDAKRLAIKGIGPAKMNAFRDAGYATAEDFKRATEDELAAVRGIPRNLASAVYRRFHPEAGDNNHK